MDAFCRILFTYCLKALLGHGRLAPMVVFNVVWTLFLHGGGWMDYIALIGTNALLAVYAQKIVTEVCAFYCLVWDF